MIASTASATYRSRPCAGHGSDLTRTAYRCDDCLRLRPGAAGNPAAVQLPRFLYPWLIGPEAHEGAFTITDLGLLGGLLLCFANRDATLFVGARFEGENEGLVLIVPGGIGAAVRLHGKVAGSPLEDGSGFVLVRPALATLRRNKWVEVEQTVSELRIRLGERARGS